jgi:hypothetical protein
MGSLRHTFGRLTRSLVGRQADAIQDQPPGPGFVRAEKHEPMKSFLARRELLLLDQLVRSEPAVASGQARRPRVRWSMRLLLTVYQLLGICSMLGGLVLIASCFTPDAGVPSGVAHAPEPGLWWAGIGLLGVCGALFVAFPWAAVYVQVMEASRGLPVPQPINNPTLRPGTGVPAAELAELQFGPNGLSGLGFQPAGWFYLDNFAGMRIGAWRHPSHPAVAFVMFQLGGNARLRIIRHFEDGTMLMTSTRLVDVAVIPPASTYVQMRKTRSAAQLWSWHLDAEALFPQQAGATRPGDEHITSSPGDFADGGASVVAEGGPDLMAGYREVTSRWGWFHRGRRLWLLQLNPFRECWRMYWLCGISLKQQIDDGWAVAPHLRRLVCLPAEQEE